MADSTTFAIPGFSEFSEIGSGGFGTVYAAVEDFFDRPVALKVLRRGLDASDRRRFERECRAMARLSDHPNVVTLYSAGYTDDERPFIVMELVTEGSLAERLEENGRFDWREVQHIGLKMADALSHAHEVGVLHRDIKPANILMVGDEPKLTDFGIASFLDSSGATSTNVAVSWGHAPPETFKNIRDERSDLYSLGSTLHTLLTGTPPFSRAGEDSIHPLLNRLLNEEPPAIARPDVPQDLRRLIWETLRKDPNGRPQTAALVSQRLAGIKQGQPIGRANAVGAAEFPLESAGVSNGSERQSGETAEVPFRAEQPPAGSPAPEVSGSAAQSPGAVTGPSPNAPSRVRPRQRGRRWNVGLLVAVALLVGIVGVVSTRLLSPGRVDDRNSESELAGPLAAEVVASSTTDNATPSGLMPPTEATDRPTTSAAAADSSSATDDAASSESTQETESTERPTTTQAAEEPSTTTPPTAAGTISTVSTTSGATTSRPPSSPSTSASSASPASLSAPNVGLLSTHESSFWVRWDPVESAEWYDYRVTDDGEQFEAVNTTSGATMIFYGARQGTFCIHIKAANAAGATSPESSFCYDPSTG